MFFGGFFMQNKSAVIKAVCISEKKGQPKHPVAKIHLLPGHGITDWDDTVCRLKTAKPQEILHFELKIRPKGDRCKLDLYSKIPLPQYFQQAFRCALTAVKDY